MIILFVILFLLCALIALILWQNRALKLTEIKAVSENLPSAFDGFKIVHISDLHNAEFGEKNKKLISLVASSEPDIIAITGDLVDWRRTDKEVALRLAENLVKIAPTYYVTGNHESLIEDYKGFAADLTAVGVRVLDNDAEKIAIGDEKIIIAGVLDPAFGKNISVPEGEIVDEFIDGILGDKSDAERSDASVNSGKKDSIYSILLAHRPQLFDYYSKYGVELTLSGHVHGGQFRILFFGGLYAPEQGFFPKYDAGLYTNGSSSMVVSRGLGNSKMPIRINNRPEVVLIELKKS